MDEILKRISTLENKVDFFVQKEEYLVNKNKLIINDLNNVKETIQTILSNLNLKHQNNIDNIVKSINLYTQTKQQHLKRISSILELSDGRIAVGCVGGAISLNYMDYETKEWKILTQNNQAHNDGISTLCELSNKNMISSSYDTTIKVWNVSLNNNMQLIRTLTQHKDLVDKLIPLTYNRFVSCSYDESIIKIWNSETYEQI